MAGAQALGRLSSLHELLNQLLEDQPEADIRQSWPPGLPSLGWLYGRSHYLELQWLRNKLLGDDDLGARVRPIFGQPWQPGLDASLPPKEHLLNWALEIQDNDLSLLANPNLLPPHSWLENGWLAAYLCQVHALTYERMLSTLAARAVHRVGKSSAFQVKQPMQARLDAPDAIEVSQGHYRIGAKDSEICFDNEQPTQMAMLHNYRILKRPVSNAEFLFFMQQGGYDNGSHWSEAGIAWKGQAEASAPWHWRQDAAGHWYGIGLNGPMELADDMPVSGISWHEARAFCQWADAEASGYRGAILPHEFQWEATARTQGMGEHGRVWEWCSNAFEPYDLYQPPKDADMRTLEFGHGNKVRRGASLHTQPELRRLSLRQWGGPEQRHLLTGFRLVLPPALESDALYIERWKKLLR